MRAFLTMILTFIAVAAICLNLVLGISGIVIGGRVALAARGIKPLTRHSIGHLFFALFLISPIVYFNLQTKIVELTVLSFSLALFSGFLAYYLNREKAEVTSDEHRLLEQLKQ